MERRMRPNEPVIVGTGHTRFGKLQEGLEQLMHLKASEALRDADKAVPSSIACPSWSA